MRMRTVFILLCGLAAHVLLVAAPASARDLSGVGGSACILPADTKLSLKEALARSGWICGGTHKHLQHDHVWMKIPGHKLPTGQDMGIATDSSMIGGLVMVLESADGSRHTTRYDSADIARAWGPQTTFDLPAYSADDTPRALYLRFDNPVTVLNADQLRIEPTALQSERQLDAMVLFGFFCGMMILSGFYSGVISGSLHNRFAGWHMVMSFLFVAYTASSGSLVFMIWPDLTLFQRTSLSYAALSLATATVAPFLYTFIGTRDISATNRRLLTGAAVVLVINAGLMPLLGPTMPFMVRPIYHTAFLFPIAMFVVVSISALRRGNIAVRWVLTAWSVPILFAVERTLRGMNFYQSPFQWDYAFFYALAYMAAIMAMAVAWRVSRLRRDRDRARAQETLLNRHAYTDSLTGLPNRRAFEERHWRDGDYLAIMDVDHFKRINDQYGHQTGDEVLRVIGRTLLANVADQKAIAAWRLGGEEFAIQITAPSIAEAALTLNTMRQTLSVEIGAHERGIGRTITLSAGVSRIVRGDANKAYGNADRALYRAKESGRDRLSYEDGKAERATFFPKRRVA